MAQKRPRAACNGRGHDQKEASPDGNSRGYSDTTSTEINGQGRAQQAQRPLALHLRAPLHRLPQAPVHHARHPEDGWTEARAEEELRRILAEVEEGKWRAYARAPEPEAEPTFHEFASKWYEATKDEWRESTRLDYKWQLQVHLLPFFTDHLLSQITIAEVDRYRQSKAAESRSLAAAVAVGEPHMHTYIDKKTGRRCRRVERPLSATSINRTITPSGRSSRSLSSAS